MARCPGRRLSLGRVMGRGGDSSAPILQRRSRSCDGTEIWHLPTRVRAERRGRGWGRIYASGTIQVGRLCSGERPTHDTPRWGVSQAQNTRCCGCSDGVTATCGAFGRLAAASVWPPWPVVDGFVEWWRRLVDEWPIHVDGVSTSGSRGGGGGGGEDMIPNARSRSGPTGRPDRRSRSRSTASEGSSMCSRGTRRNGRCSWWSSRPRSSMSMS